MNEDLLIQYLSHRCTPAEIRELDKWIAADQANADWLFEMERIWGLKDELPSPRSVTLLSLEENRVG